MPKSVRGVMHEFKQGQLHSGSRTGPVVKRRTQAIAIALNQEHHLAPHHTAGHPARNLKHYLHPKRGR